MAPSRRSWRSPPSPPGGLRRPPRRGRAHDGHSHHGDRAPVAEGARTIPVAASAFAFDPQEIALTAGEDVAIGLTSTDLTHDFVIDEVDFHVAADPGCTAKGALRIDEPGTYTAYCSVAGHREAGMQTTVTVTE
ncbi:MAG TPA: cupredoxin domain-containing protein [Egibacteraceae bacterium]|nr:cupredoxin domain-containing protein [Egibacteraceae bacterium]